MLQKGYSHALLTLVVVTLHSSDLPGRLCGDRPFIGDHIDDYGLAKKEAAFHDAMRKLWEDHITWTRVFIISAAADSPDKAAATERLLQNQVDIGNAIKPYYGDEAGEKLTALLKEHITTAAKVVAAAKANDKAKLDDASKRSVLQMQIKLPIFSALNPKSWPQAKCDQ